MDSRKNNRLHNLLMLHDCCDSSAAFARATGLSYGQAIGLKKGVVTPGMCAVIAEALQLPVRWFDEGRVNVPETVQSALIERSKRPGTRDQSPQITNLRNLNATWLVGTARESRAAFRSITGWSSQELTNLKTRPMGYQRAASLEKALGLPEGWLDLDHDRTKQLPEDFQDRLQWARKNCAALAQHHDRQSTRAPLVAHGALEQIKSPVARALIEKLIEAGCRGLLPDAKAVQMLGEVIALEPQAQAPTIE